SRSFEQVIGLLGILRAGAAYLPLDPQYPQARLSRMLDDSGARLVLTQSWLEADLPLQGVTTFALDRDAETAPADETSPEVDVAADAPAFLMYTSGSTGRPKGVLLPHRTIVNLMVSLFARHPLLAARMPTLQFATINFDMSLYEIASALFTGSPLVLLHEDDRLDFDRLIGVLRTQQVGRAYLPTAMLPQFAEAVLAGEGLPA